jgi:hypothetical protein
MRLQHPARVASEEQGLGPRISSTEAPPTDWRADRTWDQKSAEDDLSRYPFRLEVRGAPRSLVWPDICANCGGAATERIRIRRAFYRRGRGRRYAGWFGYRVVSADVPFCGSCAARHRATVPRVSWLRRYRWFLLNPAHIATIGFAVLLAMALPSVLETPIASPGGKVAWGLLGVFIFGIVWTIGVTWWMSRPDRFEPRSEVTMACAISHDVAQFLRDAGTSTDSGTSRSAKPSSAPTRRESGPSANRHACGRRRSSPPSCSSRHSAGHDCCSGTTRGDSASRTTRFRGEQQRSRFPSNILASCARSSMTSS